MPSVIFFGEPMNGTAAGELLIDVPGFEGPDTTIFGNDGNDLIIGDGDHLFFSYLNDANISIATATNIDSASAWTTVANPYIGAAGAHTSVYIEPVAGEQRYFSVAVGAGETITLDVDFTHGTAWGNVADPIVDILDAAGNVLATNDDASGDFGSIGPFDSRLTFAVPAGGTYYIRVREFGSGDGNTFDGGEQIFLNVSVTGHAATSTGIVAGDDFLSGGAGDDTIFGMLGNDTVHGDDGNDIIFSTGFGEYFGDAGNDTIYAGLGTPEFADGGIGNDMLDTTSFSGNYTVDLVTGFTNFAGEEFDNFENLRSGSGNDTLGGTNDANNIFGGAGNDTVNGLDGNDFLSGDAGDDTLNGGAGNDNLAGGSGLDMLDGGDGDDNLTLSFVHGAAAHGGAGIDTLNIFVGGAAATINLASGITQGATTMALSGLENLSAGFSTANLTVHGSGGDNNITTGSGNDDIRAVFGDDIINSGAGDDLLASILGNFVLDGGDGIDAWNGNAFSTTLGADFYWSLDVGYHGGSGFDNPVTGTLINIENYIGLQNADDFVRGTAAENSMWGGNADDTLYGLGGADSLFGETGNDTLFGGTGNDTIDGGADIDTASYRDAAGRVVVSLELQGGAQNTRAGGVDTLLGIENLAGSNFNDVLTGDGGANLLRGWDGNDRLNGRAGADELSGGDGSDRLFGEDGDDSLLGGAGIDHLYGGGGTNQLSGGADNDFYYLDSASDVVSELADEGIDLVYAGFDYTLGDNVENLVLQAGTWDGTGNGLANSMRGTAGTNTLLGLGGDDRLFGEGGADTLSGGAGADRLFGGVGRDTLIGGGSADRFVFEDEAELGQTFGSADVIADFDSAAGDRIQLNGVDAIAGGGDNAFTFIGTNAFSGTAGELRYFASGGNTFVHMDVDGDGLGDFAIQLTGIVALTSGDFIL